MKMIMRMLCVLTMVLAATSTQAAMLNNIAPDATATADSVLSSSWPASGVNDEVYVYTPTNAWVALPGGPNWVMLEWDQEVHFDEVKLYSIGYDNPGWHPDYTLKSFQIQVLDGGSWTTIDSVVNNTDIVYTFASNTAYSTEALRIYITDSNHGGSHARFLEVEVNGVPEPATMLLMTVGGITGLIRRRL